MCRISPGTFSKLLTEGIYQIKAKESKNIAIIQDELGFTLGRMSGSCIDYWRRGNIPSNLSDVENLSHEIVRRGKMSHQWEKRFWCSAGHPYCDHKTPPALSPNKTPSPDFDPTPFIVGLPIRNPARFFGREEIVKDIFQIWDHSPLHNIAIVGEPRSGKTSLLHYLKNITTTNPKQLRSDQKRDWLSHPDYYQWIFVDFQNPSRCKQEKLLEYILDRLKMPKPKRCTLEDFAEIIDHHLDKRTIILMDDIEVALAASELDGTFWQTLRSLSCHSKKGELAFVFTSQQSPAQLAVREKKGSAFLHLFGHTFTLRPFIEEEARDLILSSPTPFTSENVEWILNQGQGQPPLLQTLCHICLNTPRNGKGEAGWREKAKAHIESYQPPRAHH